jgi:K+-sensing histidine kinase KdpD
VSTGARHRSSAGRGRLRIYLGYAPGAGTTCALLSEGRQRAEHGSDVVVAHVETHGRPHTRALLGGLEVIPPVTVPCLGTTVKKMDLRAVLSRRPQVALVDDLTAQRQLIESLGGTYHQFIDTDIPAALLAFAHAEHATQLVIGASRHTWSAALQPMTTITSRVIRYGGGIGVHIVT